MKSTEYMKLKKYTKKDFKVLKGLKNTMDKRIAYVFRSKDGKIEANFFWEANDVRMRGLIWDKKLIIGTFEYAYPFANHRGDGVLPKEDVILNSLLMGLERGNYEVI